MFFKSIGLARLKSKKHLTKVKVIYDKKVYGLKGIVEREKKGSWNKSKNNNERPVMKVCFWWFPE